MMIHFQNASYKNRIPSITKGKRKKKSEAELHVRFKSLAYRLRIAHMYYWLPNLFIKDAYLNSHKTIYLQVNRRQPNPKTNVLSGT